VYFQGWIGKLPKGCDELVSMDIQLDREGKLTGIRTLFLWPLLHGEHRMKPEIVAYGLSDVLTRSTCVVGEFYSSSAHSIDHGKVVAPDSNGWEQMCVEDAHKNGECSNRQ
jgi:hypothetical protein